MLRITVTEIHHRDGMTAFVEPSRPSAARVAAAGAVVSVLFGAVLALALLLSGCGDDLDPCNCKCREPYVQACPVNGAGTCGCVLPYHKLTVPDGGAGG